MAYKMKNPSAMKMAKKAGCPRTAMKMKAEESAAMKMKKAAMKLKEASAMKMKKSAMKAEGDPKKEMTQAEKDAAIANAMPAAKKEALSKETVAGMKSYFGGVNADIDAVEAKIKELKRLTERSGASPKNQAKFEADYKEAMRTAKARYPKYFR
jgi:isopentenyl diphosphate isomerase/L-lactate dehydrogenase-like FMN-dependent dehydrogenase